MMPCLLLTRIISFILRFSHTNYWLRMVNKIFIIAKYEITSFGISSLAKTFQFESLVCMLLP